MKIASEEVRLRGLSAQDGQETQGSAIFIRQHSIPAPAVLQCPRPPGDGLRSRSGGGPKRCSLAASPRTMRQRRRTRWDRARDEREADRLDRIRRNQSLRRPWTPEERALQRRLDEERAAAAIGKPFGP